jgi:predicted metal-dependent phosphoesterase TrpH
MIFKADLHIHSVLSPCGDLNMSPSLIIDKAKEMGLNIIGISDHNSTNNCLAVKEVALENDILLLCGAEITTKEEIHCLAFVEDDKLTELQTYLDKHIGKQKNNIKFFGYQLVVDKDENVLDQEEKLLIQALDQTIYQVAEKIKELGGIFIPAHIDAHRNSIGSQLGFVPDDLHYDALEFVSQKDKRELIKRYRFNSDDKIIYSSDAHYIHDIGKRHSEFDLEEASFKALKNYFKK